MFSVWWLRHHSDFVSPYSLPYTASSPLTYKDREFITIEDIWDEIEEIEKVNKTTKRSLGQDLFHLIPLFTNPNYIIEDWHIEIINEFNMVQNFNISLGLLDDIEARKLEHYTIIHNELNAIKIYEKENG
jgi:hypothetical protein